jgi:hypothetical protein
LENVRVICFLDRVSVLLPLHRTHMHVM